MGSLAVSKAREYLGVKFYHSGRDKNGVDCAGLVYCAYTESGANIKQIPMYGRIIDPRFLKDRVSENFQLVAGGIDSAVEGDVVVMIFNNIPQHLAIFTGDTIIHAYEKAGKVVEHRLADVWKARISGVYRYV